MALMAHAAIAQNGGIDGDLALPRPSAVRGVAVVELFTSEGCSSCPPAEAVLGELSAAAEREKEPVYCLAFHVDYWNRLGWADPFSSAAFSQRQSDYARVYQMDQVYTPQMIVNGTTQFTGSDRAAAKRAIGAALLRHSPAQVSVGVKPGEAGGWVVDYSASEGASDAVVNVAVIEQGLVSNVERGENAGRVLRDPDVVRWFHTAKLGSGKRGRVALPALDEVDLSRASIVAYVQLPGDMAVLGAGAAPFPALKK